MHSELVNGIGEGVLTEERYHGVEKFFCHLYNLPVTVKSVDEAKCILFSKAGSPSILPPTSDALRFHTK